jgi:hypothetical protein
MSSNGPMDSAGCYDDALLRFHRTGPEFNGYLSNHGPMVAEVLARRGHDDMIDAWTDRYLRRLDEPPRGKWAVTAENWPQALGKVDRVADWTTYLHLELDNDPWRVVLARWWSRLLPAIAAGATHGVIRVGHAVQALTVLESAPRVAELGHALGYWAARWQPIAPITPTGTRSAPEVISILPRVPNQEGGIGDRLTQLDYTPAWAHVVATLVGPSTEDSIPASLSEIIDAAVAAYSPYAYGNPTMLVHAATAPNAVAMTLPELPRALWPDSLHAAWSASAAVIAAYAPPVARHEPDPRSPTTSGALAQALDHGGEHVIKLADTALRSHQRTGDDAALNAIVTAIRLDA